MFRILFAAVLCLALCLVTRAQAPTAVVMGRTEQVRSRVLGELRTYSVHVPESAQDPLYGRQRYPVI